jgi:hypothetical protein
MPWLHVFRGRAATPQTAGSETGEENGFRQKEKTRGRRKKETSATELSSENSGKARKNIGKEDIAEERACFPATKIHS